MARKTAKRKWDLWKKNPRCHWCGKITWPRGRRDGKNEDDVATVDHLDNSLSPERGKHAGEERTVLACYACNQKRGALDCNLNFRAEHQRRSLENGYGRQTIEA